MNYKYQQQKYFIHIAVTQYKKYHKYIITDLKYNIKNKFYR